MYTQITVVSLIGDQGLHFKYALNTETYFKK